MTNRKAFQEVRNILLKTINKKYLNNIRISKKIANEIKIKIVRIKKPYSMVELSYGEETSLAFAKCSQGQDDYDELRGLEIAVGRAVKKLAV